ncbi:hypothetical protein C1Y41_18875 [Pantoea sp. ICBG 1758]|uniref:colicin immunity protein Cui n=1 Tax=Pantoea sp. ICBG 1758 TaxID=2071682 RepID=UPI000CE3A505|nr:colicin immunity protein Cui [Pantoea sp. ICBG 1758]PPC61294.1 hypothetical protein C1Y41_18875 [Pantoea sp. ICBG 1758]
MESFKDMHSSKGEEKKIILSLILALMPLMVFLLCQLLNNDSLLLHFIYDKTANLPAVISSKSILLSKSMDVYCKTAPFLAVIVFVLFLNPRSLIRKVDPKQLVKGFISCCILLSCAFYFFMFSSFDLYQSKRFLRLFSYNDYSLTIFYVSLYAIFYMFTLALLFFVVRIAEMIKER